MNAEGLYQLFSSIITFPTSDAERNDLEQLVGIGLAQRAQQGKAAGYRISPAGWGIAMGLWGHDRGDR